MGIKRKKVVSTKVVKPGSNPDIDTDFAVDVREKVLKYVEEKYGEENVCNIVTFQMMGAKSALKNICMIYGVPPAEANKMTSLIPDPTEDKQCTFDDIYDPDSIFYEQATDFRNAADTDQWQDLVAKARAITGRKKTTGVHACGVLISAEPLHNVIPMMERRSDGAKISQWTYQDCESLGLIKMDFLGLDTVDIIQNTVRYIMQSGKKPPSIPEIMAGEMDDKKVYELFQKGHTVGIFQFGSELVRGLLPKIKPTRFEDLSATTALARPGPMGVNSHLEFAKRKNAEGEIVPIHPDLEGDERLDRILESTYGLIVFQEQIIQIASEVGGMSLQEGDSLRKAMGKKKVDLMASMKKRFMEGGLANGYTENALRDLWDTMAFFSSYGFNRCLHHSTWVVLPNGGTKSVKELHREYEKDPSKPIYIMSMFEDGSIKPHKVRGIYATDRKPTYQIRTKAGRQIRITDEHRMLTPDGYGTIADGGLRVGVELIAEADEKVFHITDEDRKRRSQGAVWASRLPVTREAGRKWMTYYQSTLTYEDRCKHQQAVQVKHPDRMKPAQHIAHERIRWLHANDPDWRAKWTEAVVEFKDNPNRERQGWGTKTLLSDGRVCDSKCEALAGEYLLHRGVDFELHKVFTAHNGKSRICDFYAHGLYFEMDGMSRGRQWFVDNKYGDEIPFVYLTPFNYIETIDEALSTAHIENGDEIVEIIPPRRSEITGREYREATFDIEMELDGPSNFIANGLVSHNSHSTSYAMNSYVSAYLKVHYPVEFMSALISQRLNKKPETLDYLRECNRMGIDVGPPSVNFSQALTAPDFDGDTSHDILFGLAGVQAVSQDNAQKIVDERNKGGKFLSVPDFVKRCHKFATKTIVENLVLAGAFDDVCDNRRAAVESIPDLLTNTRKSAGMGSSLFDVFDEETAQEIDTNLIDSSVPDYPFIERVRNEANMVGLTLGDHPLKYVPKGVNGSVSLSKLLNAHGKRMKPFECTVIASVVELETKRSRSAKRVSAYLSDGDSFLKVSMSKDVVERLDKHVAMMQARKLFQSESTKKLDRERTKLLCDNRVIPIKPLETNIPYVFTIKFNPRRDLAYAGIVIDVRPLLLDSHGRLPVRVRMNPSMAKKFKQLAPKLRRDYAGEHEVMWAKWRGKSFSNYKNPVYRILDECYDLACEVGARKSDGDILARKTKYPEMSITEIADSLEYKPTGIHCEPSSALSSVLDDVVGYDNKDFGFLQELKDEEGA